MSETRTIKAPLNPMQLAIQHSSAIEKMVVAGRGAGKTTNKALAMEGDVYEAPRARIAVVGATYMQLLTLEIAPIKAQWERMGYYKNVHYFIGEKPPRKWRKSWPGAYHQPEKINYCIWWHTGTVFQLISFDREDTGSRGGSFDRLYGVEAALLPKTRLDRELIPAIRPTSPMLKSYKNQGAFYYDTTMPYTQEGQWIFEFEEQQLREVEAILGAEDFRAYTEIKSAKNWKNPHWKRIVGKLRQNSDRRKTMYLEATARVNLYNLGQDYFDRMKRTLSPTVYDVEVENKRIVMIPNAFYFKFNEKKHTYSAQYNYQHLDSIEFDFERFSDDCRNDADLVRGVPLEITLDFNGNICSCIVQQYLRSINKVRMLKCFFTSPDEEVADMIGRICDYYAPHDQHFVKIWGDRNGYQEKDQSRATYYKDVMNALAKKGWKFDLQAPAHNIEQALRFLMVNRMFAGGDAHMPEIEINAANCKELIISIKATPTKKTDGRIEKDKSSERSSEVLPQHATHFGDAMDYGLWQFFSWAEALSQGESFGMGAIG